MIALVFPFQTELNAFLGPDGKLKPRSETVGGLKTWLWDPRPDWRLMVCGQGKVETALACQTLFDHAAPSAFLLLGSATALDPSLRVGDLVLSDPCLEWDFGGPESASPPTFASKHPFPAPVANGAGEEAYFRTGPVLSGDRNVFSPEEKASLRTRYGALALAWEGAGFHRFLRRNHAVGWELRMVTDSADEGAPALPELRRRLDAGFPALRRLIETAGPFPLSRTR